MCIFFIKRHYSETTRVGGWSRKASRWSLTTWIGCENIFLAQDRKGDKGGWVEVIDMFVQRAEDCRDTTVEVMSEAVSQGDGRLSQCGDTTNEETVTETWLMSRVCAGSVGVSQSDRKYLLWTNWTSEQVYSTNTENGRNAKTCSAVQKTGDAPHILREKCEHLLKCANINVKRGKNQSLYSFKRLK